MRTYDMSCRGCGLAYTCTHEFGKEYPSCPECGAKNYPHVPFRIRGENRKDFSIANLKSRVEVATKVVERDDIVEVD